MATSLVHKQLWETVADELQVAPQKGLDLVGPIAIRLGLATSVVEPDALDEAVSTLVAALLAAPAGAVRSTKAVLRGAVVNDPVAQRRLERETQVPLIRGMLGTQ